MQITFDTNNWPSTVSFSFKDIDKVFQPVILNKTYGYDNVSIHNLKTCDPGELIFNETHSTGLFPLDKEKDPIHKQVLNNYLKTSVLAICGKIIQVIFFNELLTQLLFRLVNLNSNLMILQLINYSPLLKKLIDHLMVVLR